MKIKPECAVCITRQVVDAVKEITSDEKERFKLIHEGMKKINEVYGEFIVPAFMGTSVHRHLKAVSYNNDPYKNLKESANEFAIKYLKEEEALLEDIDPLKRLKNKIKLSIAGNVIDFGPYGTDIDVTEKVKNTVSGTLKIDFSSELFDDLKKSKQIFYICDNAGEIIFDRVLIEELKKYVNVVVSVKGMPILNDATYNDAVIAGIDKITRVITSGTDVIGTKFEESSSEFIEEFNKSDIIIAKGMGNYESLTEYEENPVFLNDKENKTPKLKVPIYYIFKAKCPPIAKNVGVNEGDNILLKKSISKV
ncbi:protein of unknown function DUF89 [Methanococcus vannielii SB]|uniref:Damage-control phosphatase ARMT1-like metal-binding domain-containing protein n=1 Tax=Methanococcus vannielii (strain ATCC 35089 / DSM 1224 / JCM 13029 / OCM 148 / SB) TaxID=406327 RepID=A6UPQ2_METVS|nr:ARMT1-like domain-containing protein [Methanococcus vannielii]ABR54474.1 protein of unknown function DUF89 [Methanococcus vannielii SB]